MDALPAPTPAPTPFPDTPHFPDTPAPRSSPPRTASLESPESAAEDASAVATAATIVSPPSGVAAPAPVAEEETSFGDHWTARLLATRAGATDAATITAEAKRIAIGLGLAAVYGVAVGSRQGGLAFAKGAAIVPSALLAACAFGLPALYIAVAMVDTPISPRRLFEVASRAVAAAGLVLAGLAPVAMLYVVSSASRHAAELATAAGLAVGSLAGIRVLGRDVFREVRTSSEVVKLVTLFAIVGFAVFAAAVGCRIWIHLPVYTAGVS